MCTSHWNYLACISQYSLVVQVLVPVSYYIDWANLKIANSDFSRISKKLDNIQKERGVGRRVSARTAQTD